MGRMKIRSFIRCIIAIRENQEKKEEVKKTEGGSRKLYNFITCPCFKKVSKNIRPSKKKLCKKR